MNSKFLLLGVTFIIINITALPSVFGSKDVLERQLVHEERDENIRETIDGKYLPNDTIFGKPLTWHPFGNDNDRTNQENQQDRLDKDGFPTPLENN